MQAQIVHDAEVHRHHVRLKVPVRVELDGNRYEVDDWSAGGFGVESSVISRELGECVSVRMIFPFEPFELSMQLDARIVYVDREHARFGCAFVALSDQQLAVFRYLLDAFLTGEAVNAGDVLQISVDDALLRSQLNPDLHDDGAANDDRRAWRRAKAFVLVCVGLALCGLIGLGLWQRYWVITAEDALVHADVREVRASASGHFLALVERSDSVLVGDMMGTLRTDDGSIETVASPCDCIVVDRLAYDGELAQAGDPLFALVRAGESAVVRARLPLDDVERLEVGDRAEIEIPGRPQTLFGAIERIDLRLPRDALREDVRRPELERGAMVIVRPDRRFDPEDVGILARLRFL